MKRTCKFCNKKESSLTWKGALWLVGGELYCSDCYKKSFSHLKYHPIPDDMVDQRMKNVKYERISPSEFVMTPMYGGEISIHVLMHDTRTASFTYRADQFFGIDRCSGRLVSVDYDDDWEYHLGIIVKYMTCDEFKQILRSYPKPVRELFDGMTDDNIQDYLDFYLPIELTTLSRMLIWERGDHFRILFAAPFHDFMYAVVSRDAYLNWSEEKSAAQLVGMRSEILEIADDKMYVPGGYYTKVSHFKPVSLAIEAASAGGADSTDGSFELIEVRDYGRSMRLLSVSEELMADVFSRIPPYNRKK